MSEKKIIAISTSSSEGLDAQVDGRFGRCPYFTFVEVENNNLRLLEVIPNAAMNAMGGAGMQAAQLVGNKNANVVITGNLGPNAYTALSTLGMKMITGALGITVREAVEKYLRGDLKETDNATVQSHFGMGGGGRGMGGSGRGMGGGGRGMGGGRGRF
ncbi:MAG: NifB/NifX family molybdenum-iron cluster-binding protein [Candidatus Helarchaeota archaeon]